MYTILLNADKMLIGTHKEVIMQRSKLIDKLRFLIPIKFNDVILDEFDEVLLEYVLPVSKTYRTMILTKSDKSYNEEYNQYVLDTDTDITSEAGEVELHLSFYKVDMNDLGDIRTRVFKTQPCSIYITPLANWAQYVADADLSPIDQRLVQMIAIQKGMTELQEQIEDYQKNLINDEVISDTTTYSSKKIEEKFFDENEITEEISGNVGEIIDKTIDNKLESLDEKQSMTDDEIVDMFQDLI